MTWSIDITPLNDLKKHEVGGDCWCNPELNEDGVWIHNSLDNRELTEGKPHA